MEVSLVNSDFKVENEERFRGQTPRSLIRIKMKMKKPRGAKEKTRRFGRRRGARLPEAGMQQTIWRGGSVPR